MTSPNRALLFSCGAGVSIAAGALLASAQFEGAWIVGAFTALAGVGTTLGVLLTRD